jgi:thymidylate synthase (FAD)
MRGAVFADWEIRGLAVRVLEILQREAPLLFGDFSVSELPDGTRTAAPVHSKI